MRALWSAAEREEYVVFLAIGTVTGTLALVVSASLFERRLLGHG
jgi:hypothetical protein